MATPVVPSTNIGIYSSLRSATDCNQTTNLSLASICSGDTYGGITNTFGGQGGPAFQFDVGLGEYLGLEDPPMEMSTPLVEDIVKNFINNNMRVMKMSEIQERKVTIDEKEYNFDELGQEQQILIEHIENCRRQKAQIAFQMDRENVAEGAFAKMLTESFKKEEKEEVKEEEVKFKGSPKDA